MNREDKEKMRDEIMFLQGIIEGASFFANDSNMGSVLETIQNQFAMISGNVIEMMD